MGLIDVIDQLDLSDDAKQQLRAEHEAELNGTTVELSQLRARTRKNDVENEVDGLKLLFGEDQVGLLKFVRRVLLSDDSEPGLVLLSDADMELSGDEATGATQRNEITVAGAIREFISLIPKKDNGKLNLSDQVLLDETGERPDEDENDNKGDTEGAKQRLGKLTGNTTERTRSRYNGGRPTGGDA